MGIWSFVKLKNAFSVACDPTKWEERTRKSGESFQADLDVMYEKAKAESLALISSYQINLNDLKDELARTRNESMKNDIEFDIESAVEDIREEMEYLARMELLNNERVEKFLHVKS